MSLSTETRDAYNEALKKAKDEVEAASTVKDLEQAASREAALRTALNADIVPNLLYAGISAAFTHLLQRMQELGWQQSVPIDQLGLRIADCAVLADLLHVLYLPLRNDAIPMPEADHKIALQAARRLEAALSNLGGEQLTQLRKEREAAQEHRDDDFAKNNSQLYIIVYRDVQRQHLDLERVWPYQISNYDVASRQTFATCEQARTYAQDLATRYNKTLRDAVRDPAYLD